MAYTVRLNEKSSDYPEWSRVDLMLTPRYFPTERRAESLAHDLNNLAWVEWDHNHPDADEETQIAAADHAPCFEAEETALGSLECHAAIQYREPDYVEISVDVGNLCAYGDSFWVGFHLDADGDLLEAESGVNHEGDELNGFNVFEIGEIEDAVRRAAAARAEELPRRVVNANDAFGDAISAASVEELEACIRESGYDVPESGLLPGRDYYWVFA